MIKRLLRGLWNGVTLVRVALANLLFLALLLVLWIVLTDRPEPLPERAALLLEPRGVVVDERTRIDASGLLLPVDNVDREVLLADLIDSVDMARDDERIVALVLDLDQMVSIGQSKSWELGEAIARFRETGKPVVAVGDYFTQDQYRLAVEADTLLIHPYGTVALEGYGVFGNYFAEALEKLSVSVHVFRAGEFKSIAEPLLRRDMSDGEREITARWLGDLWTSYTDTVEARRQLEPGSVNALLNHYDERLREAGGDSAKLVLDAGLVDDLLHREQRDAYLAALVGATDDKGRYQAVPFEHYVRRERPRLLLPGRETVAIVTAQGSIMPGEQPAGRIGGDTLARRLRETAERDGTRAIVVRVSSGGGSVFASEVIREEMARIRDEGMPVVVSMGNVAASGGYYIATAADRVVATPMTITGSIGVFAAFPTVDRLLARGGVFTDGVGTTAIAGGLRPDRPLSPLVADALQQSVDDLYERFLGLVMEARGMDRATVDSLAQGRVLSAGRAMRDGLVDQLGSLDTAVAEAAKLAGLTEGDYDVIAIEPPFDSRQILMQQLGNVLGQRSNGLAGYIAPLVATFGEPLNRAADLIESLDDPRHLYMRCLVCGP